MTMMDDIILNMNVISKGIVPTPLAVIWNNANKAAIVKISMIVAVVNLVVDTLIPLCFLAYSANPANRLPWKKPVSIRGTISPHARIVNTSQPSYPYLNDETI